jgi:hypothetical protein
MKRKQKMVFGWAALLTVCSALLYCSWPLGFLLNPAAMHAGLASELGAHGQPYNWLFISADIVSGIFLTIGSIALVRVYNLKGLGRRAFILLVIYGICGALDAALPMHCLPSQQVCGPIMHDPVLIMHGAFDFAGSIALIGTLLVAAKFVRKHNRAWLPWIYVVGIGAIIFAVLSGIFYAWGGPGYWAQRYYITLSCVWVASLPFVLLVPKRVILRSLNN